jgi:antitoxin HicB
VSSAKRYTVVVEQDDEGRGYTVLVPALPGCVTEGSTKEEALTNAREAIWVS